MMLSSMRRRHSSRRRQVRPSSADCKEEDDLSSCGYRPTSKRDVGSGSSSRQIVANGEITTSASSQRSSRCIDKTNEYRRAPDKEGNDNDAGGGIKLINDRDRVHLKQQQKQKQLQSSSSRRHHHEQQRPSRRPSEEQSFSSSIETMSTHPCTSSDDHSYEYGSYVAYTAYEGKCSASRSNNSRSSPRSRRGGSCFPSTSRLTSRRSTSLHHRRHHPEYRSSSPPSRSNSRRRRLPDPPRRGHSPGPDYSVWSSFGSNNHGSHLSSRNLPPSSSHHNKPRNAPIVRRRSSDDLCALESGKRRSGSGSRHNHHHHHRRRDHHCSHRSLLSSSRRHEYDTNNHDDDDPTVNTAVTLRVKSQVVKDNDNFRNSSSSRLIHDNDKTPRKHNHNSNNANNDKKNKKNSIDLTIDSSGQGTFQVTSSPSTAPLQFDIQIDDYNSSYVIQTCLGLLHQIRSVHSSKNTNILRTLSHWNTYYMGEEKQLGYHRGQLGIVSMSPCDIREKSGVVPGGNSGSSGSGSGGGVKTKPTTSFTTKHDVVLMTLTGSYCHGLSLSGKEVSSFENDDVFIKELELFVTDSLWCYLRLHGLILEEELQQQQKKMEQEDDGGDCLGNSDHDDCNQVLHDEFKIKNDRKKERVLSRVFKRVIGE